MGLAVPTARAVRRSYRRARHVERGNRCGQRDCSAARRRQSLGSIPYAALNRREKCVGSLNPHRFAEAAIVRARPAGVASSALAPSSRRSMTYCSRLSPARSHTRNSCRRETARPAGDHVRPQFRVVQVLVDVDPHLADQRLLDDLRDPGARLLGPDQQRANEVRGRLAQRCRHRAGAEAVGVAGQLDEVAADHPVQGTRRQPVGRPLHGVGWQVQIGDRHLDRGRGAPAAPGELERPGDVHDHQVAAAHHALSGCGDVPPCAPAVHGDGHGFGRGSSGGPGVARHRDARAGSGEDAGATERPQRHLAAHALGGVQLDPGRAGGVQHGCAERLEPVCGRERCGVEQHRHREPSRPTPGPRR